MKIFRFLLLFLLLQGQTFAQPESDPLTQIFIYWRQLPSKQPLTQEDLKDLKEKRDYVASAENVMQNTGFIYRKTSLLFKLQYYVVISELPENTYDTTEINRGIRYMKGLYFLDYPKGGKEFRDEKMTALYQIDNVLFTLWDRYRSDGLEAKFMSNPPFSDWYNAKIGNGKAGRLIDSLETPNMTAAEKISAMEDFKPELDVFCSSVFSEYPCDMLNNRIEVLELQKQQAAQRLKELEEAEARHKRMIEDAGIVLAKADSLRRSDQPEEALKIYRSIENITFDGNHAKDSVQKIAYYLRRKYVYENYLFNNRGKLQIDTTLVIQPDVLKRFKITGS